MSRTFVRQATQIRNSDVYDDTLSSGVALETGQASLEGDLNAVRSQIKRLLYNAGAGNWYDGLPNSFDGGPPRGITDLNDAFAYLSTLPFLIRNQLLTDITVPSGQNYKVLSVAGSEAPTHDAAVTASAEGTVVAVLGGSTGAHSLTEVAGPNAIAPQNLALVRDAVTGDLIVSGNRTVYALLQATSGTVDADTFNDTTKRVQLSFVRLTSTGDDLEAVPVADIEDKVINYSNVRRLLMASLPPEAFLTGAFIDSPAVSASITLDGAVDGQTGAVTQTDRNIDWRITDTYEFRFQDSAGARDLFSVTPTGGGDTVAIDADLFSVVSASSTFSGPVEVDGAGNAINIGSGAVVADGALGVSSSGANDLTLTAGREIVFVDTNKGASTFAGSLRLSDTTAEWDDYEAKFGEVSLLSAISQAATKENRNKATAVVTGTIAADTNVTGAGGSPNLDATLLNLSSVSFTADVDIFVNGVLMRAGADASANHDVYPGTALSTGDLRFEFELKTGDVITMIAYGV